MPVGASRSLAGCIRGSLVAAILSSLLVGPGTALAQSANSTSVASSTTASINATNFDFGSAAVATLVLVLLGLTALLIIMAKRLNRAQVMGRQG